MLTFAKLSTRSTLFANSPLIFLQICRCCQALVQGFLLSRNGKPYHKPFYNQSMLFTDMYVSSYNHAVSCYQLIIDVCSFYLSSCIVFVQLVACHLHQENCKYFQQQFLSSTSTLRGGTILVCNNQQHFLYQGLLKKNCLTLCHPFWMSSVLLMILSICFAIRSCDDVNFFTQ